MIKRLYSVERIQERSLLNLDPIYNVIVYKRFLGICIYQYSQTLKNPSEVLKFIQNDAYKNGLNDVVIEYSWC